MKIRLQEILLFITTFLLVILILLGIHLVNTTTRNPNTNYTGKYVRVETMALSNNKKVVFFEGSKPIVYEIASFKNKTKETFGMCEVYVVLRSNYYSFTIVEKTTSKKIKVYKIDNELYVRISELDYDFNNFTELDIRGSLKWQSTY